jgi:hypothetical protein
MHFREMVGHVGLKEKSPVVVMLVVVVNQITRLLFQLIFIFFSICGLCFCVCFFQSVRHQNKLTVFVLVCKDGRVFGGDGNM